MSDLISFSLYDSDGLPYTGATPVFLKYVDKNGNARAQPTITRIKTNIYGFQPTDADVLAGVAWATDSGSASVPQYTAGAIFQSAAQFDVMLFLNNDGTLWTGAAPTIGTYCNFQGVDQTPASLVALATYLYAIIPNSTDQANGVFWRVDAPVDAIPSYFDDRFVTASQIAVSGLTSRRTIIEEARLILGAVAPARDAAALFLPHKTNQPFEKSPISKRDGFEVTMKEPTLTDGFGIYGQKEGEFMMVVKLGHAPFGTDEERMNFVADDIEKVSDIFEANPWDTGTQAVWFDSAETNRQDPNWWITEMHFRISYTGPLALS
jgi:hypothetical protein